jgi:alanyl-tRNA synthetase
MTTRLYYTEQYCQSFDAAIVAVREHEGRPAAILDRTAFYPTSGGQPFDTGVLAAAGVQARVLDVIDLDDGDIAHVLDRPLAAGPVTGTIDWLRRFDHMQQHTGQHVLSAAFDRRFDARTESFHLGAESSTIDLGREMSDVQIDAAVEDANRIVWEDRPVAIRFVSAADAASLPLRKEPARSGPLRLIEVEDYDLSACGGTHVARSGGIGIIAVTGAEKFRGGTRVHFLCGGRVLSRFGQWRDAMAATMKHLSVAPAELAAGIEKLQGENKALQRSLRDAQASLAGFEARALVGRGLRAGDRVVVVEALEGWDAQGLKAMAAAATAEPDVVVALFTTSQPALVVVARSANVAADAGAILKALVAKFGGRGGGKPDLAQGGGLSGRPADLVDAARELLQQPAGPA